MRILRRGAAALLLLTFLPPVVALGLHYAGGKHDLAWSDARRDSSRQAPEPALTPQAVVQVYAGRAFRWRGAFGVHTWVAVKPSGAAGYTRYEVFGWGVRRGRPAVLIRSGIAADGYWFGSRPQLLFDRRGGAEVDALIERIDAAARVYPYNHRYVLWPGPNSNTFTAYLARAVPGLDLDLPPTAIGKDYLPNGRWLAAAPSGSGVQFSLYGLFGVLLALDEGLELNLLGLTVGVDVLRPALKLPGLGRVGLRP